MAIPLEAGEQFGMGPDSAGVDFGAVDGRVPPAAFINIEHYGYDYPYYVSPLNYYTPEVKKIIESKTGNVFGNKTRTAEPSAGTYMQDIPGTAQGNWFTPGKYHRNSTDLSPSLGLARDYVDPAQPIMAIGNTVKGVNMGLYSFTPLPSGRINRDFNAVKADGSVYCYDSFLARQSAGGLPLGKPNGILLLMMPTDTTLKLEMQSGSKCAESQTYALTANAATFER
jgi:hypothetical protein